MLLPFFLFATAYYRLPLLSSSTVLYTQPVAAQLILTSPHLYYLSPDS